MKYTALFLLFFFSRLHAQTVFPIQSYLDSITNTDTLVLTASIPDRGEWGGHKEYIYLYKNKTGLLCYTLRVGDTISFASVKKDHEPDRFYYGVCKKGSERVITSFVSKLYKYDMEKEDAWNAFYHFEIIFHGKLAGARPTYAHWGEYEKMRKRVTTQQ